LLCSQRPPEEKAKQPYAIAMKDGSPFGIAGLWENWKDPASGDWIRTFSGNGEPVTTFGRDQMKSVRCATALLLVAAGSAFAADNGRYADFSGVKIHYIDRGGGEPIILLHGGSQSLQAWLAPGIVDNLQKDFRVIAYDARGAGKSDKPRDPKAYGRQQARTLSGFHLEPAPWRNCSHYIRSGF
jgi:hypothetical protein